MAGSPFTPRPDGDVTATQRLRAAIRANRVRDMEVIYVASGRALMEDRPDRAPEYEGQLSQVTLSTEQQAALTALLTAAQIGGK